MLRNVENPADTERMKNSRIVRIFADFHQNQPPAYQVQPFDRLSPCDHELIRTVRDRYERLTLFDNACHEIFEGAERFSGAVIAQGLFDWRVRHNNRCLQHFRVSHKRALTSTYKYITCKGNMQSHNVRHI